MKFIVDEEGLSVMEELLDLALKSGGLKNLAVINLIKQNTVLIPTDSPLSDIVSDAASEIPKPEEPKTKPEKKLKE